MAAKQTLDDGKSQGSSVEEDVMETCRKNLEATKQMLSRFDDLDKRWQVRRRRGGRE